MLKQPIKPFMLLIGSLFAQQALASGYHFGTQSVTAQSTANAAAAEADNASTLFANPAGLSHLNKNQVSATMNLVAPSIKYRNAKAQYYQGSEISTGTDSGKITKNVVIAPHVYGAYKLNDRVTLGLGVYVPFASSTEYQSDSKLRYNINQLGLTSIAIEPAISFKLNDQHAFGAGIVAQYSKAELRKYSDWSAAYSDTILQALKTAGQLPTDNRAAFAGHANVKGDDWGVGYHLGWLYDVNDKVRVGAAYRSKVKHNLRGHADWEADGAVAKAQFASSISKPVSEGGRGYVTGEEASVEIVTPESLSMHGMYRATDKLKLFGDVTWTRHSRFNEANLKFEHDKAVINTATTGKTSNQTTIKPNWRDTFKVAVGGSYQLSHPLQVRAGIAFDQSPVRDASSRLNTLPDGNRVWFSAGLKYDFNDHHSLDLAYSHVHINHTSFQSDKATGNDVDSKGFSSADFKNSANILGVQYTYQF